jgi:transposase InsO family protein
MTCPPSFQSGSGKAISALFPDLQAGAIFPIPPHFYGLQYVEVFYNRQRRHSTLEYLSPIAFEKRWYQQQNVSLSTVH